MRILKIIQHPDSGPGMRGTPGIAVCSTSNAQDAEGAKGSLMQTVIFQFRPHAESDIPHFSEGAVVQLVAPYHQVSPRDGMLESNTSREPLPLPSLSPASTQSEQSEATLQDALKDVIVCSKFLFVR